MDAGDDLALFTGVRDRNYYTYYFPDSVLFSSTFSILKRSDRQLLWEDTANVVLTFLTPPSTWPEGKGEGIRKEVFVFSEGFQLTYHHLNGMSPDDVEWLRIRAQLATTNVFYDNGQVQLYQPVGMGDSQAAFASAPR